MPSKKNKGDQEDEEPPKPLGHYVKDRLELTKQLFSCLKKKQIKARLPVNLQTKNIQRIQQICLDEILGISTKRLLSIINNTKCPDDTESDSEIEHISLSEISSDSDMEDSPNGKCSKIFLLYSSYWTAINVSSDKILESYKYFFAICDISVTCSLQLFISQSIYVIETTFFHS